MMKNTLRFGWRFAAVAAVVLALLCAHPAGTPVQALGETSIVAIDWSPDGNYIARVLGSDTVEVLDLASGATVFTSSQHQTPVRWASVKWHPTDDTRLAAGLGSLLYIWDIATEESIVLQAGSPDGIADTEAGEMPEAILSIDWNPSGDHLAACSIGGFLRTWTQSGEEWVLDLDMFVRQISSVAWSPDSELLYVGASVALVKVNPTSGEMQRLGERSLTPGVVTSIDLSPDGQKLVSGTVFGQVLVWDATDGDRIYFIENLPQDAIQEVRWNPDGSRFASAGPGGTVRVWDAATGEEVSVYQSSERIFSVAWSPDGEQLAYSGESGTLEIVTPGSFALYATRTAPDGIQVPEIARLSPPMPGQVLAAAWNPGRTAVLVAAQDGAARRLWLVRTDGAAQDITPAAGAPDLAGWR